METDEKDVKRKRVQRLLRWQIFVSWIFILIGFFVPIHVAIKYGASSGEIRDRSGVVIGTANYLLLGIGLGVFAIAMGAIGIAMAKRSLTQIK
jgi:hypothetical protein